MNPFAYPSLFLRTSLHIGLALAAFIIISGVSVYIIGIQELRGYMETRKSTMGQEAAEVLAGSDIETLKAWMETEAPVPDNVIIFIFEGIWDMFSM